MRSRSFEVFTGGTKTLEYHVKDANGNLLDASNISAKLYDENMAFLQNLTTIKKSTGIFEVTINTASLSLTSGKYIVEFSCVASGSPQVRRDLLYVRDIV